MWRKWVVLTWTVVERAVTSMAPPVREALLSLKRQSLMIEGSVIQGRLFAKLMAPPDVAALLLTKVVRRMVA